MGLCKWKQRPILELDEPIPSKTYPSHLTYLGTYHLSLRAKNCSYGFRPSLNPVSICVGGIVPQQIESEFAHNLSLSLGCDFVNSAFSIVLHQNQK
jgi:hypothetical protein